MLAMLNRTRASSLAGQTSSKCRICKPLSFFGSARSEKTDRPAGNQGATQRVGRAEVERLRCESRRTVGSELLSTCAASKMIPIAAWSPGFSTFGELSRNLSGQCPPGYQDISCLPIQCPADRGGNASPDRLANEVVIEREIIVLFGKDICL